MKKKKQMFCGYRLAMLLCSVLLVCGFTGCSEETGGAAPTSTPKPTTSEDGKAETSEPDVTATPEPTEASTGAGAEATPEVTAIPEPTEVLSRLAGFEDVKVGDIVTFGSYEQDADISNGAEPIEWYVLDVQGDSVLLLSNYILDAKRYNEEYEDVTWETCTLRSWLNNEFYNTAFTSMEKGYIRLMTLDNLNNPKYGTEGGSATADRVFLLSLDEVKRYFSFGADYGNYWEYNGDTRLLAHGTRQAYKNNLYLYDLEAGTWHWKVDGQSYSPAATGWWWLRSPGDSGYHSYNAAGVDIGGDVFLNGVTIDYYSGGIRPAIWLNLNP